MAHPRLLAHGLGVGGMTLVEKITKHPATLPEPLPLLLSEKQTSALTGLSLSFLRKSRSEGTRKGRTEAPPYVKVNGRVYYRRTDVERWIDELPTKMAV